MASAGSIELSKIPKRTREWVHQHEVPDVMGPENKMYPAPVSRRERRAVSLYLAPNTTPYVKP